MKTKITHLPCPQVASACDQPRCLPVLVQIVAIPVRDVLPTAIVVLVRTMVFANAGNEVVVAGNNNGNNVDVEVGACNVPVEDDPCKELSCS